MLKYPFDHSYYNLLYICYLYYTHVYIVKPIFNGDNFIFIIGKNKLNNLSDIHKHILINKKNIENIHENYHFQHNNIFK